MTHLDSDIKLNNVKRASHKMASAFYNETTCVLLSYTEHECKVHFHHHVIYRIQRLKIL